jgi:hypothetical protein
MPPLSQGLPLNSQTLSALSLILTVPKIIASAGSHIQERMLTTSLLQPQGLTLSVSSRRGFLKICGGEFASTSSRGNGGKVVCRSKGEDCQSSR